MCREESIRDAFIRGLKSHTIRARLLKFSKLTLLQASYQAKALEMAQVRSEAYSSRPSIEELPHAAATTGTVALVSDTLEENECSSASREG